MERLSITTHLIAVLTAFSAFTMPIALEVINRVKSRYRSAFYMDALEEIMGFKIRSLFGQLIIMLMWLLLFSLIVSALSDEQLPTKYVLAIELLLFICTSVLLVKEFQFIKTIFLATRSDDMVTDYLIGKIETDANREGYYENEVDLLVQIGCYNIEHTETPLGGKSIDRRLFEFIEDAYKDDRNHVNPNIIENLLTGLASMLTAVRNTKNREKYVYLQREYGKHLILFYDHKKDGDDIFSRMMVKLYEESIKELHSDQYWLLKADFLISVHTWDFTNPQTLRVIDQHISSLIDFLAREKPELIVDVLDRYRNLNNYDSYFAESIYNLTNLGGQYSIFAFDEISNFTKNNEELLTQSPKDYINEFIILLDKVVCDKLKTLKPSPQKYKELAQEVSEFEKEMIHEVIKEIGNRYSKRSAHEAIRTLALYKEWHCILDCYNSSSPASSRIIQIGHKLLAANINTYIGELGKSELMGVFEREGLDHAYLKAIPLLVMLSIYNWRQRNFNANVNEAVESLVNSLKLQERTISKAHAVESDMQKILYFADSPTYSRSFCSYFGIEHEQDIFKAASIKVLLEIKKFAKKEQEELRRTQPLSDVIKARMESELKEAAASSLEHTPLLHKYTVTNEKQTNYRRYVINESRETFLESTGVHHSFNGLDNIRNVHDTLAFTLINTKGKVIPDLDVTKLKPHEILFISHTDWKDATASLDMAKIGRVNHHFIHTKEPLHKYYIHNTSDAKSHVRVYNPETEQPETTLEETYQHALELEFIEEEDKVKINLDYHVYMAE
ncbi:hypothetical protein [Vibrio crassostreae]|uniref:hypothetical protein n=1 Tax=Vibrio crassostreae TaxID=246167 RepID=UPI0011506E08|nr:hypothetical protein [Vibrio crassostreae]TQK40112.1 hypothetical protein FB441_0728 [Vibrio crassostreae]CAK2475675.1 conserved membrane hypothetical protein [Vibrio crassostreae]CAK3483432.1 conserved membrane hypothetical protein [Vibrio crassostreae]